MAGIIIVVVTICVVATIVAFIEKRRQQVDTMVGRRDVAVVLNNTIKWQVITAGCAVENTTSDVVIGGCFSIFVGIFTNITFVVITKISIVVVVIVEERNTRV